MAKRKANKKNSPQKPNMNNRANKKQKRGSPASIRSDENVNSHTRFDQNTQSIAGKATNNKKKRK